MTKKDFELIANTIRFSTFWWICPHIPMTQAIEFADELEKTNERFDRNKFIRACTPAGMDGSYQDLTDAGRSSNQRRMVLIEDMQDRIGEPNDNGKKLLEVCGMVDTLNNSRGTEGGYLDEGQIAVSKEQLDQLTDFLVNHCGEDEI